MPHHIVSDETYTLTIGGSVAPSGELIWQTPKITTTIDGLDNRGFAYVPGQTYAPNVTNGEFALPETVVVDQTNNASLLMRVKSYPDGYRVIISSNNPYSYSITIPNKTIKVRVVSYMPPLIQ